MPISPPLLSHSDQVGICSPAGKIDPKQIENASRILTEWGLGVKIGDHARDVHFQFAGRDSDRLSDFQQLLDDTRVKAIFCSRGGYGINRILEKLDFTAFQSNPKWIIGYSDITLLHTYLNSVLRIESIHATMPVNYPKNGSGGIGLATLKHVLFNGSHDYTFPSEPNNKSGEAHGELIGGNLSILYSLLGTTYKIETQGKILFIEEIGEHLYHLDRMMVAMKMAGKLSSLTGLVVGGISEMKDTKTRFGMSAKEIILDAVREHSYPVCFNFPAGHIPGNKALVLGRKANLTVGKRKSSLGFFDPNMRLQ